MLHVYCLREGYQRGILPQRKLHLVASRESIRRAILELMLSTPQSRYHHGMWQTIAANAAYILFGEEKIQGLKRRHVDFAHEPAETRVEERIMVTQGLVHCTVETRNEEDVMINQNVAQSGLTGA